MHIFCQRGTHFAEGIATYSKHSKQEEEDQFISMPVLNGENMRLFERFLDHNYLVISDLEQHQFARAKWIKQPECDRSNHRTEKTVKKYLSLPHPNPRNSQLTFSTSLSEEKNKTLPLS